MANIAVKNNFAFADGKQVAFRKTPNVGGLLKPEGIILHDTAGGLDAEGSINWLCNPAAKASAHVVVGRNGVITQLVPFNQQAWHAGKSVYNGRENCNRFTIGIEIVNPGKLSKMPDGSYKNDLGVKLPAAADVEFASTPEHGIGYWLRYTGLQVESVLALCVALNKVYDITFVSTHWYIAPGRKIDVNPLFPVKRVRDATLSLPA